MDSLSFCLTLILLILALLYYYLTRKYNYWQNQSIPCIERCFPFFGNMYKVITMQEAFTTLCERLYKKGDNKSMIGFYQITTPCLLLRDPELIKKVLITNFSSFKHNQIELHPEIDPLMSRNPFFSRNEIWKENRIALSNSFSSSKLKMMFCLIRQVAAGFDKYLKNRVKSGEMEVQLKDLFALYTGEIVSIVGMGVEGHCFDEESNTFGKVASSVFDNPSISGGFQQVVVFFLPRLAKFLKFGIVSKWMDNFFRESVKRIVESTLDGETVRNDFLHIILESEKSRYSGKNGEKERRSEIGKGSKIDGIEEKKKDGIDKEDSGGIIEEDRNEDVSEEDKRSSVIKEDKKSSVIKEDKKSSVIKEDKRSDVVKEDKRSSVSKENKRSSVSKEDKKSSLIEEDKKSEETDKSSFVIKEDILATYVLSFILDGHETSGTTLSFLAFQLSMYPEIQEKVREEINTVYQKYNETWEYESLKDLVYLEQTINESMRLNSALGTLVKVCSSKIQLEGFDGLTCRLEPGDIIALSILGLHKDPRFWSEPEKFDPDRFGEEEKKDRHRFVFLPFGEGPRMCLGRRMAMMSMKMAIVAILSNFSLHLSSKSSFPLKLDPRSFFTAVEGGLWVIVKPLK